MVHQLFLIFNWLGSEWVLVTLLALSILTLWVILQRASELNKLNRASNRFWAEAGDAWFLAGNAGDWKTKIDQLRVSYPSLETETLSVLSKAMGQAENPEQVVQAFLDRKKLNLEKLVGILGTIGSNGPFIGLLGTVLGIIRAFHDISAGGIGTGMESITGGIAEALVATAVGLVVAVPSVIFYNIFTRRISNLIRRSQSLSLFILGQGK